MDLGSWKIINGSLILQGHGEHKGSWRLEGESGRRGIFLLQVLIGEQWELETGEGDRSFRDEEESTRWESRWADGGSNRSSPKPYSDGTSFLNYVWVSILSTRCLRFSCTNSDGTNISMFITEVGGSVLYIWALQSSCALYACIACSHSDWLCYGSYSKTMVNLRLLYFNYFNFFYL